MTSLATAFQTCGAQLETPVSTEEYHQPYFENNSLSYSVSSEPTSRTSPTLSYVYSFVKIGGGVPFMTDALSVCYIGELIYTY